MHEVGLMQEALRIALAHAERNGAVRIHRLAFRIGLLAGVEPDAVQLAFEVVTQDTMAEGAELEIEHVPAHCWCIPCNDEFQATEFVFRCPKCEHLSDDIRQGREFDLTSVEIS
jgi:hydrogenase nickel incorporation protein HypA/HybF